jgi:hypothetical protein
VNPNDLPSRIEAIEARNRRVEADKAWETSLFRRALIAGLTYGIAWGFLLTAGLDRPGVSALVPAGGYLLSTLSLPVVRRWWTARFHHTTH